jgi:Protein of unknown function DUF262
MDNRHTMNAPESVPHPLEHRPEAITLKIEDLMSEVQRGRLRIPPFQRKFLWTRKDAWWLLDSLYRGYPVGTLLFWNTRAEAGDTAFGSVVIPGAARPDAYWVVDGQQRVVSLVRTLLAAAPEADEFALYFDLDTREIVVPPSVAQRRADSSRWLPMTNVVDSERLMRWVFDHVREQPSRRDLAFDIGKRVREYPIPAYVVRAESDAPLRDIFNRINSRGKPMKAQEVFDALNGVRSEARPSSITQIADDLGHSRFGRVDEKILYRLLRVLQGADVVDRTGDSPKRLSDVEAGDLYARTAAAARSAIEFVESDAGIPHFALLPYKQPLVALGKFFDLHPQASRRSRELLARWVWRGALAATHRGDTASSRRVLDAIDGDEDESVQRLLVGSGVRPPSLPDAASPFNFRHAVSKLEALALMDLVPRDVFSGQAMRIDELVNDAQDAWILPSVIASKADGGLLVSITNRLLHPDRPGISKQLRSNASPDIFGWMDSSLLHSHGIDAESQAALVRDDSSAFLAQRQRFLRQHFESFFTRRARWDDSDRPSIASLLADDGVN